jgi:hypothetical protein
MNPYSFTRPYVDKLEIKPMFGPFRRLNRANTAVVSSVNVADFESGALLSSDHLVQEPKDGACG